MDYIKTLSQAAKDLNFTDLKKFKSQFSDLIFTASGQELVDQELVEFRIAELGDPLSDKFQGRKPKRPRKSSRDNIGLMQSRIERKKLKIKKLQKTEKELEKVFQKSKSDFDQLQHLTAQVKVSEAKAGLKTMEDEVSTLIQGRIKSLKDEIKTSKPKSKE